MAIEMSASIETDITGNSFHTNLAKSFKNLQKASTENVKGKSFGASRYREVINVTQDLQKTMKIVSATMSPSA